MNQVSAQTENVIPLATIDGVRYMWTPEQTPETLYGERLLATSLVPAGMLMTLRTVCGQELHLRGEIHGEDICFFHITVQGGYGEIGHWTPLILPNMVDVAHGTPHDLPTWAHKIRRMTIERGE